MQGEKAAQIKVDVHQIRTSLEDLAKLEVQTKPVKMDISVAQEIPGTEDEMRYTEAEWTEWSWWNEPEAETEQAAPAETPTLDALGKGGKGKGKGKGGWSPKGKGKGAGAKGDWSSKGKGKGKGYGESKGYGGKGEWIERRYCNKCGIQGHIARDCKAGGQAASSVAASPEQQSVMPQFAMLRMLTRKPKTSFCDGFSPQCDDGECGDDNCKSRLANFKDLGNGRVIRLKTPVVPTSNKFDGLSCEESTEGDSDDHDMPTPSVEVAAKKSRGRMAKMHREPQKIRRRKMVANNDGANGIAMDNDGDNGVVDGIHGDTAPAESIEGETADHTTERELEDKEERRRLVRERTETIRVCAAELERLDAERKRVVDTRNACLRIPPQFRPNTGLTEGGSQSLMKPADGRTIQHAMRAPVKAKPVTEMELKADGYVPPGGCTIESVKSSFAGVERDIHEPDTFLRVGKEVALKSVCGLWAKQALSAVNELPRWERVVLTVDSGASDTVLPPHIACNIPLTHSPRVGTEYEVANGGTVVNLGERKAQMKLREGDADAKSMLMSFQVVEVHKPLLAVSRLVENGHLVNFSKNDPHILLSTGVKVPMKCNLGTYEVEVWLLNPGFNGPR
jgi:hypothetical protein